MIRAASTWTADQDREAKSYRRRQRNEEQKNGDKEGRGGNLQLSQS